jgi:hypothetical protein
MSNMEERDINFCRWNLLTNMYTAKMWAFMWHILTAYGLFLDQLSRKLLIILICSQFLNP